MRFGFDTFSVYLFQTGHSFIFLGHSRERQKWVDGYTEVYFSQKMVVSIVTRYTTTSPLLSNAKP